MITYVNTVLVGKGAGLFTTSEDQTVSEALALLKYNTRNDFNDAVTTFENKIVVEGIDDAKFRVGMITNKPIEAYVKGEHTYRPLIKWSNAIKKADIKSFNVTNYNASAQKEDSITIDFNGSSLASALSATNATEKRIMVRLTFKDMPTRYRKWTESYEAVIQPAASATAAAQAIAEAVKDLIVKNYKRARIDVELGNISSDVFTAVSGSAKGTAIRLTALPYDDDEVVDSISPANKVRFSANVWYTDPKAKGFASKNKYAAGCKIKKTPGIYQVGEWKLVRDAEAQAMGYQGILNRGECTWPIIKPDMNTMMLPTKIGDDIVNGYDSLTLEFENMYRTADDLHRRTKQTLQIFELTNMGMAAIMDAIKTAAGLEEDVLPEIKLEADEQPDLGE